MTYSPKEDSYLLAKEVKKCLSKFNKKQKETLKVLDMGSGSGIQAKTCIKSGIKKESILCADIDKEVIEGLKKQNFLAVQTNLFTKISKKKKFDLIIFNPPYLPEDKYDKARDTSGGKKGYETIIRFLKQAKSYLAKNGTILLLFSSLSDPNFILEYALKQGYWAKKISEEKLFFEKLFVYSFKL